MVFAFEPAVPVTVPDAAAAFEFMFLFIVLGKEQYDAIIASKPVATVVSQVVNLRLAGGIPRKERRTTGKVGECRRNPVKISRICATTRLREELLEKMGILEKTSEKEVESPREKGEP